MGVGRRVAGRDRRGLADPVGRAKSSGSPAGEADGRSPAGASGSGEGTVGRTAGGEGARRRGSAAGDRASGLPAARTVAAGGHIVAVVDDAVVVGARRTAAAESAGREADHRTGAVGDTAAGRSRPVVVGRSSLGLTFRRS